MSCIPKRPHSKATDSDLLLGANANEHSLRYRSLDDYRVISFATHAIVAGEIEGVTEPALVLSPSLDDAAGPEDGLLTSSKIANLSLDANLVILSACNTAASDGGTSGRGLSGLANSFFFAGARAVAVTQWAVFSSSAQQLAAGLIANTATSASHGVSAGLRAAMIEYIDQAAEDYLANPRFWGAFIIAGDGAVNPLDTAPQQEKDNNGIALEAESLTPGASDSEFLSMSPTTNGSIIYAAGMERPPSNEKRAGSYLARIDTQSGIEVTNRDPLMAAHSVKMLGDDIALSGFFPNQTRSSAVWRLLRSDGEVKWQHVEESEHWDFPIAIIQHNTSYFIISLLTKFDNAPDSEIHPY